jgi:hypothetical protein
MHANYLEDQAFFYKQKITQREQLDKALRIENNLLWASSPNLETPKAIEEKKPRKSLLSYIKMFSL